MVEEKNIQKSRFVLGQFFTPTKICKRIIERIDFSNSIAIEPSFGKGAFIHALSKTRVPIIGIELDKSLYNEHEFRDYDNVKLLNENFYDFTYDSDRRLIFVGNPPFRTPAYSLTTHKAFISSLTKKYKVLGLREEVVFFILHTIDLILHSRRAEGEIHYIVPMSIVKNNSLPCNSLI